MKRMPRRGELEADSFAEIVDLLVTLQSNPTSSTPLLG